MRDIQKAAPMYRTEISESADGTHWLWRLEIDMPNGRAWSGDAESFSDAALDVTQRLLNLPEIHGCNCSHRHGSVYRSGSGHDPSCPAHKPLARAIVRGDVDSPRLGLERWEIEKIVAWWTSTASSPTRTIMPSRASSTGSPAGSSSSWPDSLILSPSRDPRTISVLRTGMPEPRLHRRPMRRAPASRSVGQRGARLPRLRLGPSAGPCPHFHPRRSPLLPLRRATHHR